MTPALPVHIRWMIRRDLPQVLAIESTRADGPWNEEDFLTRLRERNCVGFVAEHGDRIVGFMVYDLHKTRIGLMRLTVNPDDRGRGIGRQLVDKIKTKLGTHRRPEVTLLVRESNLDALLFLRRLGFLAIDHYREYDAASGDDAYLMSYLAPDAYPDVPATV